MEQTMIALLRHMLCGAPPPVLEAERLEELYTLAKQHDVTPLVAAAMRQGDAAVQAKRLIAMAIWRYERQQHDLEVICRAFEAAALPFIPLKGTVLRALYPEPWMRSSCDIDILVHAEDLTRARAALEALRFQYGGRTAHDISLISPNKTQIDLHYHAVEQGSAGNAHAVLKNIWEHASAPDGSVRYALDDEMLYFYHIAHMAKHFENGGFGVRQFLDLWLLNHKAEYDREKREQLLREGSLLAFERAAVQLAEVWLSGAESDRRTEIFAHFILRSGIYINTENRAALGQRKKGGRMRYIYSRLFLPYEQMKLLYPVLQKHRWLLPVMYLRRCGRLITGHKNGMSRAVRELRYQNSAEEQRDLDLLLEWVGL